MHRRAHSSKLALVLTTALLLTAYQDAAPPTGPGYYFTPDGPAAAVGLIDPGTTGCMILDTRSLLANRDIPVGEVTVSTDEEALIGAIRSEPDEPVAAIHVAAAPSLDGLPVNPHGNAVPGRFPYGGDLAAPTTAATIRIPYSDLPGLRAGDAVFLAVHAEVGEGARGEMSPISPAKGERGKSGDWLSRDRTLPPVAACPHVLRDQE